MRLLKCYRSMEIEKQNVDRTSPCLVNISELENLSRKECLRYVWRFVYTHLERFIGVPALFSDSLCVIFDKIPDQLYRQMCVLNTIIYKRINQNNGKHCRLLSNVTLSHKLCHANCEWIWPGPLVGKFPSLEDSSTLLMWRDRPQSRSCRIKKASV